MAYHSGYHSRAIESLPMLEAVPSDLVAMLLVVLSSDHSGWSARDVDHLHLLGVQDAKDFDI